MTCERCGKCCNRGDFWQMSENTAIRAFAASLRSVGKQFSGDGRCGALCGVDSDICFVEFMFGKTAKPRVCREYDCKQEQSNE